MKASLITKRFISIITLLLAVVMLFSACGGGEDVSSSADEGTESVASGDTGNNEDVSNNEDGNSTTSNSDSGTVKNVWDKDYLSTIPASVKKKEISMLMWRKLNKTEQGLIDGFQKKTGMKVKVTVTSEAEYTTKLVSMISGGSGPDVVKLSAESFPAYITQSLQPLDSKIFRLDDSCWNKTYMDEFKVNGKYYGVAMEGAWMCEDTVYVTYYLPSVLKKCNVTTMPYELYEQGNWNWDTQEKIISDVVKDPSMTGISLQTSDLYMLSAGLDFIKYDGKNKITNSLSNVSSNKLLVESWQRVATLYNNGHATNWNSTLMRTGKVGLLTGIIYGAWEYGDWFDKEVEGGRENVKIVPVAGPKGKTAYTPVRPKTWGVAKGAKNPEGAAYLLRYILDTKNCNMSETFLNKQCETVYNIVTKASAKKQARMGAGIVDYVTQNTYSDMCWRLANTAPNQIVTELNKYKGTIETNIKRANRELARK